MTILQASTRSDRNGKHLFSFLGLTSTLSVSGLSLEQLLALDLETFATPREKGTMTEVLAQFV